MNTKDDYYDLIDDLDAYDDRLTPWEIDFVESIRLQLRAGRKLSEAQIETLEKVHRTRTRDSAS
jgi:hypothetical protein